MFEELTSVYIKDYRHNIDSISSLLKLLARVDSLESIGCLAEKILMESQQRNYFCEIVAI